MKLSVLVLWLMILSLKSYKGTVSGIIGENWVICAFPIQSLRRTIRISWLNLHNHNQTFGTGVGVTKLHGRSLNAWSKRIVRRKEWRMKEG